MHARTRTRACTNTHTHAHTHKHTHTHTHTHTYTPLTPYRAELMQEEMKYHYLRGKHTSVHTHTNHSFTLTHPRIHVYIYIYTSCSPPQKNQLNSAQEYSPDIKDHICLFSHQSNTAVSHGLYACACFLFTSVCCSCVSICMRVCIYKVVCRFSFVTVSFCFCACLLCVGVGVWVWFSQV